MARDERQIEEITAKFQRLAVEAVTPPTVEEVAKGWSLLGQLNAAIGLFEPHTGEILSSLRNSDRPDHNAVSLGIMGLNLCTEGVSKRWDGTLMTGTTEEQQEKVKRFSRAMQEKVEGLLKR